MKIISPSSFKNAFLRTASARTGNILREWENLTDLMLSAQDGLLQEVASEFDLRYFREYWKLDAILYEKKDESHFAPDSTFAENITVAIEHENKPTYSHVEANKLGLFNTPLGVLITYPGRNEGKLLKEHADIFRRSDIFSDFGQNRHKLVVFGKRTDQAIQWSFNVFNGAEFNEI